MLEDGDWQLTCRGNGKIAKTVKARELWDKVSYAAWACADPGIQFHTTINDWHTCPAGGEIRASNPCSEYMFLDDTACNLASLNLMQFRKGEGNKSFDVEGFEHAVRLWTMVLEISVLMAQFPSKEIAQLSYDYRTLGLGFANIGGLLMSAGVSYDSREGRAMAGAISALMTGVSYATSAEMAGELGAFPEYAANKDAMLRVIRNHRRAAYGETAGYEKLAATPVPLDLKAIADTDLAQAAKRAWDEALAKGKQHGFRNAQASVIAPTGTIGLVMDCDTTGVEPDFALVKFKTLAGGGYFKIINRCVPEALANLGYGQPEIDAIVAYAVGHGTLEDYSGRINYDALRGKGFGEEQIGQIEAALEAAFDIRFVFNKYTLGAKFCREVLKLDAAQLDAPDFDMLKALGFARADIDAANLHVCGAMTLEGAPYLKEAASAGVRLRQSLRAHRQARAERGIPYPHDGGGAALHLGRHLQDHQHGQQRRGRRLRRGLYAVLEAGAEGQCAVSRRLQAVAAAGQPGLRLCRRGGRRRPAGSAAPARATDRGHRADRRAGDREDPQP